MKATVRCISIIIASVILFTSCSTSLPDEIFDIPTQSEKAESRVNELNAGSRLNELKSKKMTEVEIDYDLWAPEQIACYNDMKSRWNDYYAFIFEIEELFRTDPSNEEKVLELKKRIDETYEKYRNDTSYTDWYNSLSAEEKEERKEVHELLNWIPGPDISGLSVMLSPDNDEFFRAHWGVYYDEIQRDYYQSDKFTLKIKIKQSLNQLDEVMRLYENGEITAEQGVYAVDYIWDNRPRYGD